MSVMTVPTRGSRNRCDLLDRGRQVCHGYECHARPDPRPDAFSPSAQHRWQSQFAEAVVPLLDRLHRLARRILRSDDLADDAVQEALIGLWREGRLPPNPVGWLTRAVVHRSLHLNRCRRRRRCHEECASLRRFEFDAAAEASRSLEAEELRVRIEAALLELPARFREVFVLREVEQLDYESIAGTLRIPVGTVRSRLSRSREALQQALGDCGRLAREDGEYPRIARG